MSAYRASDLRQYAELLSALYEDTSPLPVPMHVLEHMQELVGADRAAGYVQRTPPRNQVNEWVTRPSPTWLDAALTEVGPQDPLHASHHLPPGRALAISDYLSEREFTRLKIYEVICEPLRVGDSLRLYLNPGYRSASFFFFDRTTRGFSQRERTLLETLAPSLESAISYRHMTAAARRPTSTGLQQLLTPAEQRVARLVARGMRNAAIAAELDVSVKNVEQRLTLVYRKLAVSSRTELILRLARPRSDQ